MSPFARRLTLVVPGLALVTLAAAPQAQAQDWKGMGRIEGRVVDPDGKPVADATVKVELPSRGGTTVKTDKKGRWALGGIAAGQWNIDVDAPGFATRRVSATLGSESDRLPPGEIKPERSAPHALPYLSRAIALDASYVDGYFQRGMTYIGLGKMAEAKADLQKVIALAPGSAQAETAKKALEQLK